MITLLVFSRVAVERTDTKNNWKSQGDIKYREYLVKKIYKSKVEEKKSGLESSEEIFKIFYGVAILKCQQCERNIIIYIKHHEIIYKNFCDVRTFNCERCPYKTSEKIF